MSDYRAVFTAGSRRRVIVFKAGPVRTREELERLARNRLPCSTTLAVGNWDLARLERLVYRDEPVEKAG